MSADDIATAVRLGTLGAVEDGTGVRGVSLIASVPCVNADTESFRRT